MLQPTCGVCGRPGCEGTHLAPALTTNILVPGEFPEERSGLGVQTVPGLPAPLPIVVLPGSPACPPDAVVDELLALVGLLWAHVDPVDLPLGTSTRVARVLNRAGA